jgi:hypothetical protein
MALRVAGEYWSDHQSWRPPLKKYSRPNFGAREGSRGSTRFMPRPMRFGDLSDLLFLAYLIGLITGPTVSLIRGWFLTRFQVLARGWFSAGLPEQALNHRPALPVGMGAAYSSRSMRCLLCRYYMPVCRLVKQCRYFSRLVDSRLFQPVRFQQPYVGIFLPRAHQAG